MHNAAARHLIAPLAATRNWPTTVEHSASSSSKAGCRQANPGESRLPLRVWIWTVWEDQEGNGIEREEKKHRRNIETEGKDIG